MSDTPAHDDHWRRLASELGLDVGPEPEQPAPPTVEPETLSSEEAVERPSSGGRSEVTAEERFEQVGLEPPARGRRGRIPVAEDEASLFEAETVPPAEAEIEGSDVEAAAVPEVSPEAAEEASDEVADEQAGKRRRRRRSRRKKKGADVPAENAAAEEPAAGDAPADSVPEEEEEPTAEVVANWNVPSWDELIASLHRPER